MEQLAPERGEGCTLAATEIVMERLRDLVLRFPCTLLRGLRWSVLSKVYDERCADIGDSGPARLPSVAFVQAAGWLKDLVRFEEVAEGDWCLHLHEAVGLVAGRSGQLACWPLLVQRLTEIVRSEGTPQQPHAFEALRETEPMRGDSRLPEPGSEVMGVLLSQLKPLLRRHWDPTFDERAVGYLSEAGTYVSIKKMKHLITALLDWRLGRLSGADVARRGATSSVVDAALAVPMVLVVSQRHNDMVLCCPGLTSTQLPRSWAPLTEPKSRLQGGRCSLPPKLTQPERQLAPRAEGIDGASGFVGANLNGDAVRNHPSSLSRWDSQRADAIDKQNQRLRIENAELKKRLRFGFDSFNSEIRRLRIENAELKKRLFMPGEPRSHFGQAQGITVRPVWVSTAPTLLTPLVNGATTSSGTSDPLQATLPFSPMAATVPSSGSHTPDMPQSMTQIPHGYCYAVPVSAEGLSPTGWGHFVPPLVAAVAVPASATSPFLGESATPSDGSFQERLLPKSLLASDPSSNTSFSTVSPDHRRSQIACDGAEPAVRLQDRDDRWVCIPSGIVDGRKAQFEARRWTEGVAADQNPDEADEYGFTE